MLWLLRPKAGYWNGWDVMESVVVRAPDEALARKIAQQNAGSEDICGSDGNLWLTPGAVVCEPLRHDGPDEVICRNFCAG